MQCCGLSDKLQLQQSIAEQSDVLTSSMTLSKILTNMHFCHGANRLVKHWSAFRAWRTLQTLYHIENCVLEITMLRHGNGESTYSPDKGLGNSCLPSHNPTESSWALSYGHRVCIWQIGLAAFVHTFPVWRKLQTSRALSTNRLSVFWIVNMKRLLFCTVWIVI